MVTRGNSLFFWVTAPGLVGCGLGHCCRWQSFMDQAAQVPFSVDPGSRGSALLVVRQLVEAAVWWVATVLVGILSGYVFAAPEGTGPWVTLLTFGGACTGLALASVMGHLRVHRWWGIALVWAGFMLGMVPPLSDDDALWLVAAAMFGCLAAVYVVVVNLLLMWAFGARSRRRS